MTAHLEQTLKNQSSQHPRDIAKASRSSFLSALFFLNRDQKRALEAVYAFARVLDDAVDDWHTKTEQSEALLFWEEAFEALKKGTLSGLLMQELNWALARFSIPLEPFDALIRGCRTDITQHRYTSFSDLEAYCYDVASTIGLISLPIFEIPLTPTIRDESIALGKALQLTNILRDVHEDFKRGRIYIPLDDFKRFGYTPDDIGKQVYNDAFYALMTFEAERAATFFKQADNFLQRRRQKEYVAPWLMGNTYATLLDTLRKQRFQVFGKKVAVSQRQLCMLLIKAWAAVLFRRTLS